MAYIWGLVLLWILPFCTGEPLTSRPWLRICDKTKSSTDAKNMFFLSGSECSGGYMFTEPFSSGMCVCGNGVWVLKTGYCDSGSTFILFADGNQCFNIKTEVRWIRYIGHPERAKVDSHYIASRYWDYIEKLRKSEPSRLIASKQVWSLAVGDDPENIYLPQSKQCFRSDWRPESAIANPLGRVGFSSEPPADSIPEPHLGQQLSYCPYFGKEISTEWIQVGGMVEVSKNGAKYYPQPDISVHGDCHKTKCSNAAPMVDKDYSTTVPPLKSAQDALNVIDLYPFSDEFEGSLLKQMSDLQAPNATYNSSASVCMVDNATAREMDLQTLRMIRSQTAYSLKQVKAPRAFMREYQYLQRARMVLTDKCPALSPTLLRSFIRMFRFVLLESLENHPYRQYGQDESHARILNSMGECFNNTKGPEQNISFVYVKDSCPRQFSHAPFLVPDAKIRNCSTRIPQELMFDSCKHDLVTEVTWKVILFAHYFCSRQMANFSQDHSEFYATMERMFNPDVLMRYYNPGNSYPGLKFVFQMYDLDEFMSSLDKCVACARDVSQWRAWLKRPKNIKMCPMKSDDSDSNIRAVSAGYDFNTGGYTAIARNPLYLPYYTTPHTVKAYQCYSSWKDGLYTRPPQAVQSSCGLGMHVLGETVSF